MVVIPDPDLRALVAGETVIAFVDRGTLSEGAEVALTGSGPRPDSELKPAYRRWAGAGVPDGSWSAIVVSVEPAASLDVEAGASRHILAEPGTGDLAVLRVYEGDTPVLSDDAFDARVRSLEGALRA